MSQQSYLNEVAKTPLLTAEQEQELARKISAGDEDARNDLVEANLRLVVSIAQRYKDLGLPLEDLIQEGNLGLMQAVDRFDQARKLRFSTYAGWWIRKYIKEALDKESKEKGVEKTFCDICGEDSTNDLRVQFVHKSCFQKETLLTETFPGDSIDE